MVAPIGIAFFLLAAAVLAWKRKYAYVLAVGMLAPAGYAITAGDNGVPVFYLAAIGAGALVVIRFLSGQSKRAGHEPGRAPLLGFVAWAGLVTLVSPLLFKGIPVLTPREAEEYGFMDPGHLEYTISNLAQLAYLVLGAAVVIFLARGPRLKPGILGIGLALTVVLSFAQVASYYLNLKWPDEFFVNPASGRIIDGETAGGDVRFRGIYTEPSGLAIGSLTAFTYFVTNMSRVRGTLLRLGSLALIVMSLTNMAVSTSTTALVGIAVMALVFTVFGSYQFFFRGAWLRPISLMLGLLLSIPLIAQAPRWISMFQSEIGDKIGGTSFDTRMGGNLMSFDVLVDTWFMGAGLGSHKPFALWANLIANTGLIGTALFAAISLVLATKAWKFVEMRPTVWALVAVLVAKTFAGSALGEPIIWMCFGLLANAVWTNRPALQGREAVYHHLGLTAHWPSARQRAASPGP